MIHAVDIETEGPTIADDPSTLRYRWRCACTKAGPWRAGWKLGSLQKAARSARRGGERHTATMERG